MTGVSTEQQADQIVMTNGEVEVVVPTGFGPRVLRYAARGGQNVLGAMPAGDPGQETPFGQRWHARGGHRLWYGPEDRVRTYFPDNEPVGVKVEGGTLTLEQKPEGHTGLRKQIALSLGPSSSELRLLHRIDNTSAEAVDLAPWAVTMMHPGGVALVPNAPFIAHPDALLPARTVALWHYTRVADGRFSWGEQMLRVRQDRGAKSPQKIGLFDEQGWAGYAVSGSLFLKRFGASGQPSSYPDRGCNVEIFTNADVLELESLGPLVRLEPGQSVEHLERWFVFPGFALPDDDDRAMGSLEKFLTETA